jgi:integrase
MASDTSGGATVQGLGTTSDTSGGTAVRARGALPTALPEDLAGVFAAYAAEVSRPGGPLDDDSVRVYCSRVRQFLAWLASAAVDGYPLTEAPARDWAVRDYRTHLLTVARRKPSTVNAHLTAVDDFYRRRGLGPAAARREELPKAAPRALDKRAQLRWLRAAEQASPRDRALALVGFYAGLRIGEAVALDLGISARKGHLVVRYGKGGRYREVPLHPVLRTSLETWLKDRLRWPEAAATQALFLNRRGGRLSTRGAYSALAAIAEAAGIEVGRSADFTPHVLRHTAGTTLTRSGTDIILVAELLGHSVETARRYALPNHRDRQAAIERLTTDQ